MVQCDGLMHFKSNTLTTVAPLITRTVYSYTVAISCNINCQTTSSTAMNRSYPENLQPQKMEIKNFITDEPNELVANLLTPVAQLGKLADWKNGYGKYTVVIILLYAAYNTYTTDFPMNTIGNWLGSLYICAQDVLFFLIAFYIYKGSITNNKNLLVINSKGILYNEETLFWTDILIHSGRSDNFL